MVKIKNIKKSIEVFWIIGKHFKKLYNHDFNSVLVRQQCCGDLINHFKMDIQIKGLEQSIEGPCLLLGNHISYLDIPILIYSYPEVSFVSKKEVKFWPVIGHVAHKIGTIFVDRNSPSSRSTVKNQIENSLKENNQKVVIFPSGTTSLNCAKKWRRGAFEIAQKNDFWVRPFRIKYLPERPLAYIDDDTFIVHLYQLFNLDQIKVSLEFHPPVKIKDSVKNCDYWKNWCES